MLPEVLWANDANVEAARKLPGWREFHRACGEIRLFFDHPQKKGRNYLIAVFTGSGYETRRLCEGVGKTVIEALGDAYQNAHYRVPVAEECLARMRGAPAVSVDVDDILGGDPVMDYEDILG